MAAENDEKNPGKRPTIPMPKFPFTPAIGIALGGGGTKGSFQLGALKYLYEHVFGVTEPMPKIIAGTSVGAINAVKLSEGGQEAFAALEKLWLRLQRNEDMYDEQEWVKTLSKTGKRLLHDVGSAGEVLSTLSEYLFQKELNDIDVAEIKRAIDQAKTAKSINHLGPIAHQLDSNLDTDKVQASGIKLRLSVVNLAGGQLRYVTETGAMLERDNTTQVNWPGAAGAGQWGTHEPWYPKQCRALANIANAPAAPADTMGNPGTTQSNEGKPPSKSNPPPEDPAPPKDKAGARRELQACLKAHPFVNLKQAALASAAIPIVFQPGRLFGEDYADGGVRESVPIQVAMDCGATKTYAIVCSPELAPSGTANNLKDIGLRSIDVMLDEIVLNEVSRASGTPGRSVVLIRPSFSVHDALTIQPGLIRISMDNGYMRAADTIELADPEDATPQELKQAQQLRQSAMGMADKLSRTRLEHWTEENAIAKNIASSPLGWVKGPPLEAVEDSASRARQAALRKRTVRDLARARLALGHALPPGIERSWLSWECHSLAQFFPALPIEPPLDHTSVPQACHALFNQLEFKKIQMQQPGNFLLREKFQKEIKELEARLLQCVRNHTNADPMSHGLLIKSKAASEVFILYGGAKLLLRGSNPLQEMRYDPKDILEIPVKALARLPQDRPADGTLLANSQGETFIIEKGKKRKISLNVPAAYDPARFDREFTSVEQDLREIRRVPAETLKAIP